MLPTFRQRSCQTASAMLTALAFASLMVALLTLGHPTFADENLSGPPVPPPCDCDNDCRGQHCVNELAPVCPYSYWCSDCGCFNIGGCQCQ